MSELRFDQSGGPDSLMQALAGSIQPSGPNIPARMTPAQVAAGAGPFARPSPGAGLSVPQVGINARAPAFGVQPSGVIAPPPADLVQDIVRLEGAGEQEVSPKGAIGKFQVLPETAKPYLHPGESLFDPAVNERVGTAIIGDLSRRYNGDPVAVKVAYNAGPGAADKWIASGRNPAVLPAETQHYIGVLSEREQQQSSAHADLQRIGKQTQSLIDAIVKEGGRSKETWDRLGEVQAKMQEYQERALKAAENPPSANPTDSMQKLGGIATIVGILGGLLTKQPLAASLNAGGAAMEGYNQNDQLSYKRNLDQWKYHTEVLMKMADFEHQQYRDILADEKAESGDRMNRLHVIASLLGNERVAAVAQIGDERAVRNHVESMNMARERMGIQQQQFAETQRHHQAMETKGTIPEGQAEYQAPEKWEGMPDKPPPGSPYNQAIWTAALSYAQTGKMPAIGMSSGPRTEILKATPAALQALGMKPSDAPVAQAEYHGMLAAESTLGRRLANLTTSIDEASKAAPAVLQTSQGVSRTEFPAANEFGQWLRMQTGDPNIVRFKAALNTFLNIYAKGINPTGQMTDQQQRHAYETLATAMSQGQIEAGVDQLTKELGYAKEGLSQAAGELPGMFPHTATGQRAKESSAGGTYGTPDDVYKAFDEGKVTKEQAKQILIEKFGAKQ